MAAAQRHEHVQRRCEWDSSRKRSFAHAQVHVCVVRVCTHTRTSARAPRQRGGHCNPPRCTWHAEVPTHAPLRNSTWTRARGRPALHPAATRRSAAPRHCLRQCSRERGLSRAAGGRRGGDPLHCPTECADLVAVRPPRACGALMLPGAHGRAGVPGLVRAPIRQMHLWQEARQKMNACTSTPHPPVHTT